MCCATARTERCCQAINALREIRVIPAASLCFSVIFTIDFQMLMQTLTSEYDQAYNEIGIFFSRNRESSE